MASDDKPVPRIARIQVQGLFGLFDHDIELKLAERVTVLHGPNGVGKTTLLRMIAALFTFDVDALLNVPFAIFRVARSDGAAVAIEGKIAVQPGNPDEGIEELASKTLTFHTSINGASETATLSAMKYPDTFELGDSNRQERLARLFATDRWRRHGTNLGTSLRRFQSGTKILFITAQRLFRPFDASYDYALNELPVHLVAHPGVWSVASDLQRRIQRALLNQRRVAETLDQSFPTRLLQSTDNPAPVEELRARLQALEVRRTALQQSGLLDESHVKPLDPEVLAKITSAQSGVMTLYAADNEQKLAVFDELASRIEVFLRMINGRFLRKTVRVDREKGLQVLDPAGQPLELRVLSSGEQHQLVMFYDLLFQTPRGALVLIDEPELSQHVTWQRRFLPDLLEIARLADIDAIVATHSPSIIGGYRHLLVALSPEAEDSDEAS